jgi:uncharacterized protein (DUF2235 family)
MDDRLDTLALAEGTMPKVIAVFADGTGNSAAKLFKTNVWRLYDALDTSDPGISGFERQIAYYHDGVGTSSFKPLAIAGGAFGWGLKRNVIDLYTFVCRNYQPGDRICAFGFSRGAFTVRLLAGMIAREGLVANTSERELETYARDAYRQYRRRFNQTKGLVGPLRNLRDFLIAKWQKLTGRNTYAQQKSAHPNHDVEVDFLGVWDTVAAYGMPIAEITRGIDDWVWPLSMPNYRLSPKVKRARHALALDDERDTFHPLFWDEEQETDPDRIKQVWFAGMHSDVGGGYPDDSLAYVSLDWMLTEAAGAKLRFQPKAVAEIQRMMSANGALHDSRRGVGAYYRYQPRKISAHTSKPDPTTLLMQDPERETSATLVSVKIHDSVFRRIEQGTDRYAPIVLPDSYTIVSTGRGQSQRPVESSPDKRAEDQERVWDRVWKRRVNYFLTVGFSAYLLLLPLWNAFWPPSACAGPQCLLAPVIRAAGSVIPAIAHMWVDAFAAAPGRSAFVLVVIALLLGRSKRIQTESRDEMRALWEKSMGLSGATTPPKPTNRLIRKLRRHPAYQHFFQSLKWTVLPVVFGWLILAVAAVLVVALLTMTVLRVGIWRAESSNAWCEPATDAPAAFETTSKCRPLPGTIDAGQRYRVTVNVGDGWRDLSIDTSPEGFGLARMGLPGNLLAPLRRSLSAQWFQPLVKIVPARGGFTMVPLEMQRSDKPSTYTAQFTAPKSGRAYFFVNDVLLPAWVPTVGRFSPTYFYENNQGTATIQIESIPSE